METNAEKGAERFIIRMVVDNQKGVMARIATLLARKGYNISSICVGKHLEDGEAGITLTIHGPEIEVEQAKHMLGRLVNVISAESFHRNDVIERELCLIKVKAHKSDTEKTLTEKAGHLSAKVVAREKGFIVLEIVDYPPKVEEFVKVAMKEFEVMDISRSGASAI